MDLTPSSRPPVSSPLPQHSVDAWLSSTTPDVAAPAQVSAASMITAGSILGVGIGLLAGRSRVGAGIGAAVGAGVGASLVGADHVSGGALSRVIHSIGLNRRAQIWFILSHPTLPWLAPMGLGVARDARAAQTGRYGPREPKDGPQDAFRHAYAAALFSLRAMRDHGQTPTRAHDLALGAGAAHERDGQDNNDAYSRAMDLFNNEAGTRIVGTGTARDTEPADAAGYLTELALQERVLAAMAAGQLQLVDRTTPVPTTRPSSEADLPAAATSR